VLSRVDQVSGKPLSFNNLADLQAARTIATAFQLPACAIIKHANPCGVAVGANLDEAYARALAGDPLSAFGAVIAVNRPVTGAVAERMIETKLDVIFAPGYDDAAREVLSSKPSTRVLEDRERRKSSPGERDIRRVLGGVLIQDRDNETEDRADMQVVSEVAPGKREWEDILFAWRTVHFVRSNAVVIARDLAAVGIGAGQMSRVDAVKVAASKAGERAQGAVLASDGFFPFADGPEAAFEAGVRAIVQPGGSVRDAEVIAAANSAGAAMVFTGRRHFLH
jgi:phosphoribosylaminoimidazolecarboxamide formyltransferase/IMP cyclohydrolase